MGLYERAKPALEKVIKGALSDNSLLDLMGGELTPASLKAAAMNHTFLHSHEEYGISKTGARTIYTLFKLGDYEMLEKQLNRSIESLTQGSYQ